MSFLANRCVQPEIMDDPNLSEAEHLAALQGLARVHRLTGTAGRLWRPIERLFHEQNARQLSIMDVGCGDGLLLRKLARRATAKGLSLRLIGCDFSPRALDLCQREAAAENLAIELHQVDVTSASLPHAADVIINSLFLHHFSEPQVIAILQQFRAQARGLVVVEDLLRSRLGYGLCWLGVHLLTRSRVVHVDGLLSVRAAFSMSEMQPILQQAGMSSAKIYKHWPERFMFEWSPAAGGIDAR